MIVKLFINVCCSRSMAGECWRCLIMTGSVHLFVGDLLGQAFCANECCQIASK